MLSCWFVLSFCALTTSAAIVHTSLDRDSITVGERFRLHVSMHVSNSALVIAPEKSGVSGQLSIRAIEKQTNTGSPLDSLLYTIEMIALSPGEVTIPEFEFIIQDESSTDTVHTPELTTRIASLIPEELQDADIQDLKPPQRVGKASRWWFWITIALLLLILVIIARKKAFGKREKIEIIPPPKPPYDEAVEALEVLEKKELVEKGYVREYVFELSEIFKRYISRRYSVNASEFTTEEMRAWIGLSDLGGEEVKSADWFFQTSDPVKFARVIPEIRTIRRFGNELRFFLESTKLQVDDSQNSTVNSKTAKSAP